ncbi:MAG TPA: XRE family transcriptional regulator [Gemmatimonadaceae bacterium]
MAKRSEIVGLRHQLAREIVRALGPGSEYTIAPHFGIRVPRMSELARGRVDRCSLEWLIERVYRMGGSVTLTVTLGNAGREYREERFRRQRCTASPPRHRLVDIR